MQSILVIDDNKSYNSLMTTYLTRAGYQVKTAKNGVDGLKELQNKKEKIDMILLDLMMPILGGESFLAELHSRNLCIPVIIISAKVNDNFIKIGKTKNIIGYFSKVDDPQKIIDMVSSYFTKRTEMTNVLSIFTSTEVDFNISIINESEEGELVFLCDKDVDSNSILRLRTKDRVGMYRVEDVMLQDMKTLVRARSIV